jgi:hypothetical protein
MLRLRLYAGNTYISGLEVSSGFLTKVDGETTKGSNAPSVHVSRPDLSILCFLYIFWLGQGVTWVMYVFLYCLGVLQVYGVVYHLGVYVCLWLPRLVIN